MQINYAIGLPVIVTYDTEREVFTFDVDLSEFADLESELEADEQDIITKAAKDFQVPTLTASFTKTGETFHFAQPDSNAEIFFVEV